MGTREAGLICKMVSSGIPVHGTLVVGSLVRPNAFSCHMLLAGGGEG